MSTPIRIAGIATRVPGLPVPQAKIAERMIACLAPGDRDTRRIRELYRRSGIDTRHTVLPDFITSEAFLFGAAGSGPPPPLTGDRNALYVDAAMKLAVDAAHEALAIVDGPAAVTHVVTASCTGFHAPEPATELVRCCRLAADVERYHLGFMGCSAAFPALRLAHSICSADPSAVVLVACVEICTIHFQADLSTDALLANSLFADGAAAVIVTGRPVREPTLRIGHFASRVDDVGRDAMQWTIGNHGFRMRLSREVPGLVGSVAGPAVDALLGPAGLTVADIPFWAIHPGGKAILDRIERALALPAEALTESRAVLARYGNMSSPTVLFVLDQLLAAAPVAGEPVVAMSFGPGLTTESALFHVDGDH